MEHRETRSEQKHRLILDAATEHFLSRGYERTSMDDVARAAGVSKQTIYLHFDSKASLLESVVTHVIGETGFSADPPIVDLSETTDLAGALGVYARAQLRSIIRPTPMRLRRLIISESSAFPELARRFFALGPQSSIDQLIVAIARLHDRGLLHAPQPDRAAIDLNWLVLADPINRAMFLEVDRTLTEHEIYERAQHACATFLAAYGPHR